MSALVVLLLLRRRWLSDCAAAVAVRLRAAGGASVCPSPCSWASAEESPALEDCAALEFALWVTFRELRPLFDAQVDDAREMVCQIVSPN